MTGKADFDNLTMRSDTGSSIPTTEILHHLGELDLPYHAVSPPIFQTSIFCFPGYEEFQTALSDETVSYLYSRGNNPTVNLLEKKLAALEHGERAKLVASGVAAASLAVMAQVSSGDHIVAVEDCYVWSRYLMGEYLARFGVSCTFVEGIDTADFERAIRPNTKVIFLESPTTFTFKLQNLKEIAEVARKREIKTIIDNTWATPLFQNPLDHGIDLVIHSASKYLGGNSDIIGGVIVGSRDDIDHIFTQEFLSMGPAPDPMQAWLIMRGLRTLHLRMPVHFQNALALASLLESHGAVEDILYPFLPSSPQYSLAQKQMRGGAGLFSFRLKTRRLEDVKRFTNRLRLFKRAVSWGGYESLIFPAAVKYDDSKQIPDDKISLIRCHAGIEDVDLLIEDIKQALQVISQ